MRCLNNYVTGQNCKTEEINLDTDGRETYSTCMLLLEKNYVERDEAHKYYMWDYLASRSDYSLERSSCKQVDEVIAQSFLWCTTH